MTEEETAQKDALVEQGFPDWSRRDFQQFIKGLEAYGWFVKKCSVSFVVSFVREFRGQPMEIYAADIQEKSSEEVEKYYKTFVKKWKTLSGAFIDDTAS